MQPFLSRFSKNIWILVSCQTLAISSVSLLILVGGLLGTKIATDPKLATLPLALMIIGTACATVPAALLMQRVGRKYGYMLGMLCALIGALMNMTAALQAHFVLLLVGSFFIGSSLAFTQQFRFAAIESVKDPSDAGIAVSLLLVGGILAAFLGPEAAVRGKDLLPSPHGFAGSFMLLAIFVFLAGLLLTQFENPQVASEAVNGQVRPLSAIVRQPVFIVAVLGALIGYAIMSFLMTATPISMHEMQGHSLTSTKWVIQSHVVAMFLPSLFTGVLIKQFGALRLLMAGTGLFALTLLIALLGHGLMHYWWALVLLGVGWNFLFIGGTALLPQSYTGPERFKVQATNDFLVFAAQAIASLSAGWLLFQVGWQMMIWSCLPVVLLMAVLSIRFRSLATT